MDDVLTRAISWVRRHVFLRSEHVAESAGAADKGRPILTDSNGQIDATLLAAATLLAKLLTVDGAGSGLDADLLDGVQGSSYQLASGYTAADVLAKLLTVDGAGSGLDADLLDSLQATAFALLAGRSGGQSLSGGTAANDDLTLQGTTHSTRTTSYLLLQPNGGYVGVGNSTPDKELSFLGNYLGIARDSGNVFSLLCNAYWDWTASAWKLSTSDFSGDAGRINMAGDYVSIDTFAGAAAGDTITWVPRLTVAESGNVGVNTDSPTISDGEGLHIAGKIVRVATAKSPASNGTGNVGEICWDTNYLYVCTASNTWKRVALTGGY